jgi:putative LysE/RhtB family amino acid efflux pump
VSLADLSSLATHYLPVGIGIGVAAAAPIGPVNILVIQRTLQRGVGSALLMGLGAALGDALFALVAAFGLTALASLINAHGDPVRLAGGLVLIGFGVAVWKSAPHLADPGRPMPRTRHLALATLVLTITNPATLLWFAGAFGSIGFKSIGHATPTHLANSALLVAGVFLGSMLWWLAVASAANVLKGRLEDRHLTTINHVSAVLLILFGIAAIIAGLI